MNRQDEIQELIQTHRRRWYELQKRKARQGDSVEVSVITEIQDIEDEIAKLRCEEQYQIVLNWADNGHKVSLSRFDLNGRDLDTVDLSGAKLNKANLSQATLVMANLSEADLRRADLKGADLSGAVLKGTDFRRADLRGAVLKGTDLSEADLSEADLREAVLEEVTKWPNTVRFRVWDPKADEYKTVDISREQVIKAFEWYDNKYPGNNYKPRGKTPWTKTKSYHWAVWHNGNFYPPKLILRYIVGEDKGFWGGEKQGQANMVYRNLGFDVTAKPHY